MIKHIFRTSHRLCLVLAFGASIISLGVSQCADTEAPYAQNMIYSFPTNSSAHLTWSTYEKATSQIEYGLSTDYGQIVAALTQHGTAHETDIEGLSPGQTYHFRILTVDDAGNAWTSLDYSFLMNREVIPWEVSTPESEGLDGDTLLLAKDYAKEHKSKGIAIIRHGKLVAEWYWDSWDASSTQQGFSLAKSFTGTLIGIGVDEGWITSIDQKTADFIPEWLGSDRETITLRHLLSMTSGLDSSGDYIELGSAPDQGAYARGLPAVDEPGSNWHYLNSGSMLLAEIVREASGIETGALAKARIFEPLGLTGTYWVRDSVGHALGYISVVTSARGFAKFGQLYLQEGQWQGKQIISKAWVKEATVSSQQLNPDYGLQWWTNANGTKLPNISKDVYLAEGAQNKYIFVLPSLDMVITRLGDPDPSWNSSKFLQFVLDAVTTPTKDSEKP